MHGAVSRMTCRAVLKPSAFGRDRAEDEEMTVPWTQAELDRLKMMVRQKASAADIAKSLGRRVGSVKTKVREMGLVPLKKPRLRPSAGL